MVLRVENEKAVWITAKRVYPLSTLSLALFVAVVSYLLACLGVTLVIPPQVMSPFWPGDAFVVSVLLLTPRRTWPVLISAGLAGYVLQSVQAGFSPRTIAWGQAGAALVILIAALGLGYSLNGVPSLNSLKALGKFCLFALLLAPSVSSFVGAMAAPAQASYWTECRTWFLGDVLAFLTVTPACLSWVNPGPAWTNRRPWFQLEGAALITGLVLLGYVIFFLHWRTIPPALLYSLVPFLLWSALRFGSGGVGTSMMVIAFSSIWGGVHGHSPFPGPDPLRNVLSLQLFLLFAAAPFMLLAVVVEERQHARLVEKELSGRLISAQEQERSRIARELHDDICQRLALLSIEIQRVNRGENGIGLGAKQHLDEIRIHCSEIAGDLQALSHELHSAKLDYLGIATAIRGFCREFGKQHEVSIEFAERNVPKFMPRDGSLCLFRIAQEALHNAVKYSGTKQFWVELTGTTNQLQLEVRDAGTGFVVEEASRNGGLGLVSMRERVRVVDGRFSLESRPGAGTRILASVPLVAARGGSSRDLLRDQAA